MFAAGDYNTTETVNIPVNSFTSDDPSASVTITNLVAGDVEVHKDGSTDNRSSDNGITVSIDFDGVTGGHMIHIDLSDNSHDGYWANGARYQVRMEGTTIDGATVNAFIGAFSIGCVLRPTTAGRTLDIQSTGEVDANLTMILASALTQTNNLAASFKKFFDASSPTGTVNSLADAVPGAAGGGFIAGTNAETTVTTAINANLIGNITGNLSGSVGTLSGLAAASAAKLDDILDGTGGTGIKVSTLEVTSTTTLTGNVSLGGTLGVAGATTFASLVVSGTTALTGAVTMPAGLTTDITGTVSGNSIHNAAAVKTAIEAGGSSIATILADTNELQTDDIPATLATIAAYLDTEVAAIKAVTDALTAAAAAKLALSAAGIVTGAAEAGTLSTTQMTTDLAEATDDHYIGAVLVWTSGPLAGQRTDITDSAGASGLLTFTAVTEAPENGNTFVIL